MGYIFLQMFVGQQYNLWTTRPVLAEPKIRFNLEIFQKNENATAAKQQQQHLELCPLIVFWREIWIWKSRCQPSSPGLAARPICLINLGGFFHPSFYREWSSIFWLRCEHRRLFYPIYVWWKCQTHTKNSAKNWPWLIFWCVSKNGRFDLTQTLE